MGTLDKIIAILDGQKKDQKELTDYLGLQKGAFTKWKSGQNQSYLKYIEKIADFFQVPVSYFYEDKKISPSPNREKLIAFLETATESEKALVNNIIDTIIAQRENK